MQFTQCSDYLNTWTNWFALDDFQLFIWILKQFEKGKPGTQQLLMA